MVILFAQAMDKLSGEMVKTEALAYFLKAADADQICEQLIKLEILGRNVGISAFSWLAISHMMMYPVEGANKVTTKNGSWHETLDQNF